MIQSGVEHCSSCYLIAIPGELRDSGMKE